MAGENYLPQQRRLEVITNPAAFELLERLKELAPLVGNLDFRALSNPERILIERHFMGDSIGDVCDETMLAPSYIKLMERVKREVKRPVVVY